MANGRRLGHRIGTKDTPGLDVRIPQANGLPDPAALRGDKARSVEVDAPLKTRRATGSGCWSTRLKPAHLQGSLQSMVPVLSARRGLSAPAHWRPGEPTGSEAGIGVWGPWHCSFSSS